MDQNEQENAFYADEDRRDDPKEYFQMIGSLLEGLDWQSLCDVGCATGDFLYHIRSRFGKEKRLTGVDTFDALRDIAASRLPDCRFFDGDIWTGKGIPDERYDVVCMSGVLYLFDDLERPLSNLLEMAGEDGTVMIFSSFNPHDCHTEFHFEQKGREGRIVVYSLEEVGRWLDEKGLSYRFLPFRVKAQIQERKDDPIRSYTVALADGTNGLINGIGQWIEQYLLVITKKGQAGRTGGSYGDK